VVTQSEHPGVQAEAAVGPTDHATAASDGGKETRDVSIML